MRILLEPSDINPDTADIYGQMPLSWAGQNGQEGVIRILLKQADVNPDTADIYSQTPLSWVVRNGSDRIAMLLPDQTSSIPRYTAVFQQHNSSPLSPPIYSNPLPKGPVGSNIQ